MIDNSTDKRVTIPTLDDIIKAHPPKKESEIGHIEYEDEDEEENLDTMSPLFEFEKPFYDDEGNFYPDGVNGEYKDA